ncbi:SH3-like domain-containing protein [Actibacterium mucosum]|uniref:SH3-like domain-containing protein n=1 Tax=Actibacterium mucosum TaxID=1087332 RepID=UPI00068CE2D4|nr:SH3-like domain-containing protein [Actibacterium mucosum]
MCEKFGFVQRPCGRYQNPENLAVGDPGGLAIDLYRVRFRQVELWPIEDYPAQERLILEAYEHWLEQQEARHDP